MDSDGVVHCVDFRIALAGAVFRSIIFLRLHTHIAMHARSTCSLVASFSQGSPTHRRLFGSPVLLADGPAQCGAAAGGSRAARRERGPSVGFLLCDSQPLRTQPASPQVPASPPPRSPRCLKVRSRLTFSVDSRRVGQRPRSTRGQLGQTSGGRRCGDAGFVRLGARASISCVAAEASIRVDCRTVAEGRRSTTHRLLRNSPCCKIWQAPNNRVANRYMIQLTQRVARTN